MLPFQSIFSSLFIDDDFKLRYNRPSYLSIHLTDIFLVMDYRLAKLLRHHPSNRYKPKRVNFHAQNGTLVKDQHSVPDEQLATQHPHHVHPHHGHRSHSRHHHHRSHDLAADDDDGNQGDNSIRIRRSRDTHDQVSACCSELEKCIHKTCPL